MSYCKRLAILLPLLSALAQAYAGQAAPAANKQPPSFHSSGIEGNIAPSGYSAGASEEQSHQVATIVSQLQEQSLAALITASPTLTCSRQADLLHATLAHPSSFEANNSLGLFYLQHGSPQLSSRYLQAAAEIRPDDAENLLYLVVAQLQAKQYERALERADRLIQLKSTDARSYRMQGDIYAAMRRTANALAAYKHSIELEPSPDNFFAAGISMLSMGSLTDAQATFASGTRLYPSVAKLWLGLGIAETLNINKPEAIECFLKAVALNPSDLLPYTLLANLAGDAPSSDAQILESLKQLVQLRAEEAIAHYDYALAMFKASQRKAGDLPFRQVESELKLALAEQPQLAAAHYQLGLTYSEAGDISLAIAELALANQIEPDVAEWHYRLARAYRTARQTPAAEQEMQEFQRLKMQRDAGGNVSANLFEGLPLQSRQQISASCPANTSSTAAP